MNTRADFEEYLNEIYFGQDITHLPNVNPSRGIQLLMMGKLGTWLRRYDPIQFNVGYHEWIGIG